MTFKKLITSSSDPKKLSLSVKGFLMALVPIIMFATGLSEMDVNAMIDVVTRIVFLGSSLVASVQILYGMLRKVKLGRWSAAE